MEMDRWNMGKGHWLLLINWLDIEKNKTKQNKKHNPSKIPHVP